MMDKLNMPTCETCRWWRQPTGDPKYTAAGHYGECHAHAPQPGGGGSAWRWPLLAPDDWCGGHAPRQADASSDDATVAAALAEFERVMGGVINRSEHAQEPSP